MSIETNIEVKLTNRDRKSAFFRLILVIPIAVWAGTITNSSIAFNSLGFISGSVALSLLFTGIYPSYLLTFNHAILELQTRISSYVFLLTDKYPTLERNDEVSVIFPDIQGGATLNRGKAIVKWILVLPVVLVGMVYAVGGLAVVLYGWFSILFTGKLPEQAGKYIYALISFWNEIVGYALVLVTDEYPGFSLGL